MNKSSDWKDEQSDLKNMDNDWKNQQTDGNINLFYLSLIYIINEYWLLFQNEITNLINPRLTAGIFVNIHGPLPS